MELPLFEQVADLVRAMAPDGLGAVQMRARRSGIKVWFDTAKPPRQHYEAQLLARRHVDGADGVALEVGFHAEEPDVDANVAAVDDIRRSEGTWRAILGPSAEIADFYGAENWRRVSEAWLEPEVDDPELAFEVASRLVDYLEAIEPARAR